MENTVIISGTIKSITTHEGSKGKMAKGWLNQRDASRTSDGTIDRLVYVAGINIVGFDGDVVNDLVALDSARQGQAETQLVTLKGRLVTNFDRRQGIAESEKRQPQLQLEVFEVTVK
jgi:hypothetical protein